MAVIKSGDSTDQLTVDPVSKAIRVTNYDSAGIEITDHVPVEIVVADVTVVNNDLIASFDASPYSYLSLQLKGTWVGTVEAQVSNDNGTWKTIVVQNTGDILDPYIKESTVNSLVKIPILGKYLRVRATAYTSGIVEGCAFGYKDDIHTGQISAVGEVTISAGQTIGLEAGANQIGSVTLAAAAGTPSQFKFINVAGTNANLIKASAGVINMLWITSTTSKRYFKLYDKASAPTVGTDVPKYTFSLGAGANSIPVPIGGFAFDVGISMACLLSAADSGTTPFTVLDEVGAMIEYI